MRPRRGTAAPRRTGSPAVIGSSGSARARSSGSTSSASSGSGSRSSGRPSSGSSSSAVSSMRSRSTTGAGSGAAGARRGRGRRLRVRPVAPTPARARSRSPPIPISSIPNSGIVAVAGAATVATRCLSWIRLASFASTSRRPGSIFWIFLKTAIDLAAKPSRANSSASGVRIATASLVFPASTSRSPSWRRRRESWRWVWSCALMTSIALA